MIKFTASADRVIRIGSQGVTAKVTVKLTDKEQEVLNLIREDPGYSMDEIAQRLSVSRKTVAARIKLLKEKGILERIGVSKTGIGKSTNKGGDSMPRQFRVARQINELKTTKAAELLQVSQPTLSAWEGERESPTIDSLEKMANLYRVSTDFLLGRTELTQPDVLEPISKRLLPVLNGKPVWTERYGWELVNADGGSLILSNGTSVPFSDVEKIFIKPPQFAASADPTEVPLDCADLTQGREIWVEPISSDRSLRLELRGWYRVTHHAIENASGNRFTLDSYGAKWLAFESEK